MPTYDSSSVLKNAQEAQYDDVLIIGRHGNELTISCTEQYLSNKELLWVAKQLEHIAMHD
jgi:hypothetical protein